MARTSNFSRNHPYAVARGWVGPNFASQSLDSVSDGSTEVEDVRALLISGGQVTDLDNGIAQISFGGLSQSSNSGVGGGFGVSSATSVFMVNNSTRDLIAGDVVVLDSTHDSAVTTTSVASNTSIAGVVQAPIPRLGYGPVLFSGLSTQVNVTGTVARGNYAMTSGTAALAAGVAARVVGTFGRFLTGNNDLPDFVQASQTTEYATPTTSLSITMPASIPPGRVLFLALWLDAVASSPTVSANWTRIGSEAGFYYFYKVSEGDDVAEATWTTASVVTASVLLLSANAVLAAPIADHDYDSTTAAAAVSGLSDAPRYAIAGVGSTVASPGSGFTRLAGGNTSFASGGAPSLIQSVEGNKDGVSFASPVTTGNVVVAVPVKNNDTETHSTDARDGGTCPPDSHMTHMVSGVNTGAAPGYVALGIGAKVAGDTYAGPYGTDGGCDSSISRLTLLEFSNLGVNSYQTASQSAGTSSSVNLGTFTVGANDVTVMVVAFRSDDNHDPVVTPNGFTEITDASPAAFYWYWVGYKIGDGDASVTLGNTGSNQHWAAGAVVLTSGGSAAQGTLAGKYIAHASSATSPFTGAGAQNDAIFAINLLQDAKPSVLIYGQDLASGGGSVAASSVTLADAGGFFTATDVEAAIAELATKDIGYQAHGNMGSTETFSALTGWHSGTFNADCTFTFSGATSGIVASMVLELLEDGTGGWQPTWPGSVVWPGGSAPTHDDTAGTTTLYLMQSRDGGTTWYGFQAGSGSSGPDLTGINFLVGTASGDLSAEIVVGTSPGGELGGTWASPTVDTTHSGSAHTDFIAKAIVDAKGDLIAATAADTVARLAVGANNTVLSADSTASAGVSYQTLENLGHWEILMAGGISSPPEPLENGTGDDWLYVWVPT